MLNFPAGPGRENFRGIAEKLYARRGENALIEIRAAVHENLSGCKSVLIGKCSTVEFNTISTDFSNVLIGKLHQSVSRAKEFFIIFQLELPLSNYKVVHININTADFTFIFNLNH